MQRGFLFISAVTLTTTGVVWAGQLPGTLNFANETGSRIIATVAETANNEKEVEVGDLDGDGDPDVVIGNGHSDFDQRRNKLYINTNGVYDQTDQSTIIPAFNGTDVSRNAFIRDYDNDGFLDIYIINDSNSGGFAGNDHMYINQLPGSFTFVDEGAARIPAGGALGAACGGVSADFDQNGGMDVYSGNYPGPSQDRGLYNTAGTGFLTDMTGTMVPSDGDYTVDVAIGDLNGDGKDDLLISNWSSNFVYYNDKNGAGSGTGDYNYSGSTQSFAGGASENSMEPGDFDSDGDLDFYWSNGTGSTTDIIKRNDGNVNGLVTWVTDNVSLPSSVTGQASRKATVADLNNDGRTDIFVQKSSSRPTVLRNTTVNNDISFVDWSPASAIPLGNSLRGWHAAAFDTNADGDRDIFIGGWSGDHLLENVPANEVDEKSIGSSLPTTYNSDPVAVVGRAAELESDTYSASDVGAGFMAVVLNGQDDYLLEVLNGAAVIATSNRGAIGVEEALQIGTLGTGDYSVRVTVLASASGTGCAPPDLDGDCSVGFTDLTALLAAWGACPGCPEDLDGDDMVGFTDLTILLAAWGPIQTDNDYVLEVLSRNG